MLIFELARKHGVSDEDILHVLDHAIRNEELSEDRWLVLGPDRAANLRAVIVIILDDGTPAVIHANKPTDEELEYL